MKTLENIILLSLITITTINASTQDNMAKENAFSYNSTAIRTTYQSMSTEELQQKVEKHSKNGNLPFALGQELIKRWTNS